MILPGSYAASLALILLTLLCWGSWANTFKSTGGKWRFELYYFDFAAGVFAAALICALTLGTLGWDGFSFRDDLQLAGKRQDMAAFAGGVAFNLGNMLLTAGISVAGMAAALPASLGTALIVTAIWNYIMNPTGSALVLMSGCLLLLIAIIVDTVAFHAYSLARLLELTRQGKTKSTRKQVSLKGMIVSVAGGLFIGCFLPLVQSAQVPEVGLGPYSAGFVFGAGVLFSTFVFNLFFMNLPVQGKPIDIADYFKAKPKLHAVGFLGGIIWYAGALSSLVATRAEGAAKIAGSLSFPIVQGAAILGVLWGVLVWKEFSGADMRVRGLMGAMIVLFTLGLCAVSFGPQLMAR